MLPRTNLLCVAALLAALLPGCTDSHRERERVLSRSYEALLEIEGLRSALAEAEAGQREYLLTGDERSLEAYSAASERIAAQLARLQEVADRPDQQHRLETLKPLVATRLEDLKQAIQLRKERGPQAAAEVIQAGRGKKAGEEIHKLLTEMRQEENDLLQQRKAQPSR